MKAIQPTQILGEHPLDAASRMLGGRGPLGVKLGVSPAAIGNWKLRGVPIEQCFPIERATCGLITRCELRPDDWHEIWPELAQAPASPVQAATENVAVQGA